MKLLFNQKNINKKNHFFKINFKINLKIKDQITFISNLTLNIIFLISTTKIIYIFTNINIGMYSNN